MAWCTLGCGSTNLFLFLNSKSTGDEESFVYLFLKSNFGAKTNLRYSYISRQFQSGSRI